MKSVVVTGVSTGIGYACAEDLIAQGCHVFGSVREQADATRVQAALGPNFTPLMFDVTDEAAVAAAAAHVKEALQGEPLAGLVNNAGVAVFGPLMHMDLAELRQQIEINVVGLVSVTQQFLPMLGADAAHKGPKGRIVNISSVSGKRVVPFMGAYSISKFGVEACTDALRRELMLYGIDVITVGPGPIKTEIWSKARQADIERYAGTDYYASLKGMREEMLKRAADALPAEDVAAVIREALFSARPRTRYAVVGSYVRDTLLPSLFSPRMLDRVIAKAFKLKPKT